MCVRGVDVQCVLQFTLINAAGCALHRRTSQVIHRLESYYSPQTDFRMLSQVQQSLMAPRNGLGPFPSLNFHSSEKQGLTLAFG